MADPTHTQTAVNVPIGGASRIVGVLHIYSGGRALLCAHAVGKRVRIGRDSDMDIQLDDIRVSRFHAELLPDPDGVRVNDRGSHNGTFVDGERVERAQTAAPAGSILRIGRALFYVVNDVTPYLQPPPEDDLLVGGASLARIRAEIAAVGPSRVSVLIEGETGTGKEIVAQAIHRVSGRPGDLVAMNCAAIPQDLIESELFGHARGAFSGSDRARLGVFRATDKGTLLLDEIGDLPADAQAKLLRILESGEVRAVGEDRATRVDVRTIAATNKPLEQLVAQNKFRADLFHRIATACIALPPLRDRAEDIPLLAARFSTSFEIGLSAMERLVASPWPGNVRELKNTVELAVARARGRGATSIEIEDLGMPDPREPVEDHQLAARLVAAIERAGGNVAQAARDLGMRRAGVYERLRRLGIDPTSFRKRGE